MDTTSQSPQSQALQSIMDAQRREFQAWNALTYDQREALKKQIKSTGTCKILLDAHNCPGLNDQDTASTGVAWT